MATKTANLNLTKPEMSDYANITDISNNFEILDNAYSKLNSKFLPLTGGTLTGPLNGTDITLSGSIAKKTTDNGLYLRGGTTWDDGGSCYLYGKNHPTNNGLIKLTANNGTNNATLALYPGGNITNNRNFALSADGKGNTYYSTDGTVGMSNGARALELNKDGNLYFNGGRVSKIFNFSYSDIKKFDLVNHPESEDVVPGEYSLQIFQDKQTLWTEMYILLWNDGKTKWFTLKSPITWKSQEGTFITTSVGLVSGYDNYYDNACTWADNNTFFVYSRSGLYQMYHFAGFASSEFRYPPVSELFYIDDTTERMTVQTNAQIELQSINNQIQELQVASVCSLSSTDEEPTYQVVKNGSVLTLNDAELNELHTNLVNRRSELLDILKA